MATTDSRGFFVWHELMTTDTKAAIAFYTDVVGWTTQPFGDAGDAAAYQMWVSGQGPLGGTMALPPEARQGGAPPHWFAHVVVGDVDATAAKVGKLGGKVMRPPEDIPEVGRFCVIQDPQGAMLSLYKPASEMPPHDPGKPGEFCWNELMTTDHKAGFAFYNELFGWEKIGSHDMGPMGEYLLFGAHGRQLGGMFTKGSDMPMPSSWIYYIEVADLDGAIARAVKGGGRVVNGPMEVPGGARIAQLMDPQGAVFAMHAQKKA